MLLMLILLMLVLLMLVLFMLKLLMLFEGEHKDNDDLQKEGWQSNFCKWSK